MSDIDENDDDWLVSDEEDGNAFDRNKDMERRDRVKMESQFYNVCILH